MTNEILQWIWLIVVSFLLLGALRQIALMLPPSTRAEPSGPPLGRALPRGILAKVDSVLPPVGVDDERVLAFVTESCRGCQALLATIASASIPTEKLALVARNSSPTFQDALRELDVPTLFDDGTIWEECHVTATPLILTIDANGRVRGKEVSHGVPEAAFAGS